MEVASESTADVDTGAKRTDYAALGILEYWRFDKTGHLHGARLAGDILDGDPYRPIPTEEVASGIFQGYSPAQNLMIRWDPATGAPIATYGDQMEGRLRAEARVQELEEENRRLRGE